MPRCFSRALNASWTRWASARHAHSGCSSNFITDDTEILNAEAATALSVAVQQLATEAKQYDKAHLPAATRRRLLLLRLALAAPPPPDPKKASELSTLVANLDAMYGKGQYCRPASTAGRRLVSRSRTSRAYSRRAGTTRSWSTRGRDGIRFRCPCATSTSGSSSWPTKAPRRLGFADAGAMWRSGYDMPPDEFAKEMDRALEPGQAALRRVARVRARELYREVRARSSCSRRSDPGAAPRQHLGAGLGQHLRRRRAGRTRVAAYDSRSFSRRRMSTRSGWCTTRENFFTSLGFAPLPATFWERSLFTQAARSRRRLSCVARGTSTARTTCASRCASSSNGEDFVTVHHELGHNFYQRAYNKQPFLFQNGANDGFHEAIGDAIALSMTPAYLQQDRTARHSCRRRRATRSCS